MAAVDPKNVLDCTTRWFLHFHHERGGFTVKSNTFNGSLSIRVPPAVGLMVAAQGEVEERQMPHSLL